ncbi:MAG: tRNA preQ1(34) S-adenosylmethionine ribosyltransferase-isomerase QueA [Clostridia bacterium]|nr:tRNA preQ1(34) S-adenosylmethionine ribosyltransferase-isomerase QueA [Clostridia bacterium]
MNKKDFFYQLPESLIAQVPIDKREMSRMMVLGRKDKKIEHKIFKDIVEYLDEGDCLVLNDTRVIPARLIGHREDTHGKMEFVLLRRMERDRWEVLVKPGKRAKIGSKFIFGDGDLKANVLQKTDSGGRIVEFYYSGVFQEVLEKIGQMPLPPYIKNKIEDQERYQTVFAKHEGSAAAPTAGLHFTNSLLEEIAKKGANIAYITLHVGLGTFRPVKEEKIEDHIMHSEYFSIPKTTAEMVNRTKLNGKRVIAVGTTSVRTLESAAQDDAKINPISGWTDIFIYPGYSFKIVDALITNFHLPESTLLMLVSAFAGREFVMNAYKEAIRERYRFFSFGDAMLVY